MSQSVAIRIEHLGKRYRYGGVVNIGDNLRADLTDWLRGLWQRNPPAGDPAAPSHPSLHEIHERHLNESAEYFWALNDINLEIRRGEVVGLIGRNGAGKSTLLKILSRITPPTTGRITYQGRVSSLLEVGTGFNRELTGRENMYMNGSILGMTRSEINRKFDAIVEFAGIDKFIDTPVKFYSSGMYVRLAFAVAAHLEPDIMLVDEVLAVGDAAFQQRCLGKMEDVAKAGRTVVFVSHSMGAIRSLTNRCVYLKDGKVHGDGPTEEVVQQYLGDMLGYEGTTRPSLDKYHRESVKAAPVQFTRIWVNDAPTDIPTLDMGAPFTIHAEVESTLELRGAVVGMEIKKKDGTRVTTLLSLDQDQRFFLKPGRHMLRCTINNLPTAPGDYIVLMGINQSDGTRSWDVILDYPLFTVADRRGKVVHWTNRPWGAVHWRDVTWSAP